MIGLQLAEADFSQREVVHVGRAFVSSLMLGVTLDATPHIGMECGWLALQQRFVVGMANDAIAGLDALDRRVTGGAIVFQKCVRLGQFSG